MPFITVLIKCRLRNVGVLAFATVSFWKEAVDSFSRERWPWKRRTHKVSHTKRPLVEVLSCGDVVLCYLAQ